MWLQDSALGSDPGESIIPSRAGSVREGKYCLYQEFLEVEQYCSSHSVIS